MTLSSRPNTEMSKVREVVEWGYKDLKQHFAINDYARHLKVLKTPIGLMLAVCCGLSNIRCCLYGSQTARYFGCNPPCLDDFRSFEVPQDSYSFRNSYLM